MIPPSEPYAEAPLGSWLTGLFWPLWEQDTRIEEVLYTIDVVLWIAVLVTLAVLGARALRRTVRERRWRLPLALAALFAAGLALRWTLATFGPGDLGVNQAAAFTWVYRGTGMPPYGAAPIALIRIVFAFFGESYSLLIWVSLITGSAAPMVLVLALRRLGRAEAEAWIAGALLAIHPLAVRFAGEGNRGAQVILLFCLALFALAHWLASERRGWLVFAGALTLLLCHSRPEAVMGLLPLATIGLWKAPGWRARAELALMGALVLAAIGLHALQSTTVLQSSAENLPYQYMSLFPPFSAETAFWLDPLYSGYVLVLLTAWGATFGFIESDPVPTAAALGILVISYLTQSEPSGFLNLANVRYQMLAVPCVVLVCAYVVWRAISLLPWRRVRATAALLAVLGIGASCVVPLREVTAATTVDEEFHFVRDLIDELPDGAYVLAPYNPHVIELGMRPMEWEFRVRSHGGGWVIWDPREPIPDLPGPRYYYRSASCSGRIAVWDERTDDLMRQCGAGMKRFAQRPLRLSTLRNRPMAYEFYADPVVVGLYAIDD